MMEQKQVAQKPCRCNCNKKDKDQNEIRCVNNHLLAKKEGNCIVIKCHRCKHKHNFTLCYV